MLFSTLKSNQSQDVVHSIVSAKCNKVIFFNAISVFLALFAKTCEKLVFFFVNNFTHITLKNFDATRLLVLVSQKAIFSYAI